VPQEEDDEEEEEEAEEEAEEEEEKEEAEEEKEEEEEEENNEAEMNVEDSYSEECQCKPIVGLKRTRQSTNEEDTTERYSRTMKQRLSDCHENRPKEILEIGKEEKNTEDISSYHQTGEIRNTRKRKD